MKLVPVDGALKELQLCYWVCDNLLFWESVRVRDAEIFRSVEEKEDNDCAWTVHRWLVSGDFPLNGFLYDTFAEILETCRNEIEFLKKIIKFYSIKRRRFHVSCQIVPFDSSISSGHVPRNACPSYLHNVSMKWSMI